MFDALKKMIDRGPTKAPTFETEVTVPEVEKVREGVIYVGCVFVSVRVDMLDIHGNVMTHFGTHDVSIVRWGVAGEVEIADANPSDIYNATRGIIAKIVKDGVTYEKDGVVHWVPPHRILDVSVKKSEVRMLDKAEQFEGGFFQRESAPYSLSGDESVS